MRHSLLSIFASVLLSLCPSAVTTAQSTGEASTELRLYDAAEGPIKGWSHIVTHPERFPLIRHEPAAYAVDASSMAIDAEGGGKPVFRTVLVRKMSNWGQQHANGLEPVFFDRPLPVERVKGVVIRLKFHSGASAVPTFASLQRHYGPYLESDDIRKLDTGLACLGLSFLEAGYNDQSTSTLNAIHFAEFDPSVDFDRWIDLSVPLSAFQFGFERNYAFRPIETNEASGRSFVAFRINPETTGGIVARNLLGDAWDDSIPELYKEMALSIESITIELSPRPEPDASVP